MALEAFRPTVWSRELLRALEKVHVFTQGIVVNRNYEGEIRAAGDSVKIGAIGEIVIGNYTRNADITDPQDLDDAQTTLVIDQQKYFAFQVDDVDAAQANINVMPEAMSRAGYGLANTADQFVAGLMIGSVPTANQIGSTVTPETLSSAAEAYEYLVDLKVRFDQANVPDDGRRTIICPPWFVGQLLKDDRFVKAATAPAIRDAIVNGFIREVAGMNIVQSNNTRHETTGTVGEYSWVVGCHPMATSFAEQIIQVEAYRMEKRFADAVKGLHVYGGKVVRPECLVALVVDRPIAS